MFREVCEELPVLRVNEYRFYELGKKIRSITNFKNETTYAKAWWSLLHARIALEGLKEDPISMRISVPAMDRLIAAISEIVPLDFSDAADRARDSEGSPTLTLSYHAYELNEALKEFEPVLAAECTALDTYVVSQKRGYHTPDLVDRSEIMLDHETRAVLPIGVISDIKAAGRCLAFDIPTAAGFHILRAVEAVMGAYYTHLTGNQLAKRHRNWGLYLQKLTKLHNADSKIRGALEHIKECYRNPIAHPDATLTEGQAIMLFGLSLSVIELMAETLRTTTPELPELEKLKAETVLAEQRASGPDDF